MLIVELLLVVNDPFTTPSMVHLIAGYYGTLSNVHSLEAPLLFLSPSHRFYVRQILICNYYYTEKLSCQIKICKLVTENLMQDYALINLAIVFIRLQCVIILYFI